MRKYLLFLSVILMFSACDDGDIILVHLDFDNSFEACGNLVFYNISDDPFKSISLKITQPVTTLEDIFKVTPISAGSYAVKPLNPNISGAINGSSNLLNYRSYNSSVTSLFCMDIPPSDLDISEDYSSYSGSFTILTSLIEDDNDGVPSEMEDRNKDGNLYNDDSDSDGIPDFLDEDDDGDNVLTKTELLDYDNTDNDGNPLTDPKDTDGDGIPNYLDPNDDGDLVLTRDEENMSADRNPANDFTNGNKIPDYLNIKVAITVPATGYREHNINQKFLVSLKVDNISFSNLNQDSFNFGFLSNPKTSGVRKLTPRF